MDIIEKNLMRLLRKTVASDLASRINQRIREERKLVSSVTIRPISQIQNRQWAIEQELILSRKNSHCRKLILIFRCHARYTDRHVVSHLEKYTVFSGQREIQQCMKGETNAYYKHASHNSVR